MGRRTKIIIAMSLSLLLLLSLFAIGSGRLFLGSFTDLEYSSMQTEVSRAEGSIRNELETIDTLTTDYSGWDDAYRFVQDGNRHFIKSNLNKEIFAKLKLNLIVYLDHNGAIVFSRLVNYRTQQTLPISSEILTHLSSIFRLTKNDDSSESVKGFVKTADRIMMLVSRPVLTSDFKGPVRGLLVMGRYLDQQTVREIAERTRRTIAVVPLAMPNKNSAVYSDDAVIGDSIVVKDDTISGIARFDDIYGKKAFLLKVETPRSIFREGQKTVNRFFILLTGVTLLSAGGIYIIFERLTSSLRRQRESEMQYHTLVQKAAEGIVIVTKEGYFIIDANDAFASLVGKSLQDMRGCSLKEFFEGTPEEIAEEFERILVQTRELKLHRRSGSTVTAEVNASEISHQGNPVLSLIVHNVSERKHFEDQLMYQANHDPLTNLPNRILLNDRLSHALALARRKNSRVVFMLFDLDHFKVINDTMGHSFGDLLLCAAAERFRKLVRESDTIARIGGDEFVAVLTATNSQNDVITIANRFLAEISMPYNLQGQEINLTTSIGIAQFPEDGDSAETLFKKADTAMYAIKDKGRNGIQFYSEEMNLRISKRMSIESRLRKAIEQEEFSLHYQPQIDLTSGRIVGMEALLRWTNSELGTVSPVDFIPVAEDSSLIVPIGKWALNTACMQHGAWMAAGMPPLRMAVNLSPRQFLQKDLVETIEDILDSTGINPACLDLEVTESLMMNNIEDSIAKMVALKKLGVSLSIDDFGTGYSSLNCLQRFPLDILKVDRSFVMEIGRGNKSVIIRAIVAMAHSLGFSVVAEGVETVEQLNFLRNHRCEEVQGYYFSRPLPAADFFELVSDTVSFSSVNSEHAAKTINSSMQQLAV